MGRNRPSSSPRPGRTENPSAVNRERTFSRRRLLPIPGSPCTTASRSWPRAAAPRWPTSSSSSRPRPSNGMAPLLLGIAPQYANSQSPV